CALLRELEQKPHQTQVCSLTGDCGPLPQIEHAEPLPEDTKQQETFSIGSKVRYHCLPGYLKRPSLSDTIQCLGNSKWSKLPEFCVRGCLTPPRVHFARLSKEDEIRNFFPVGVTVKYVCRPGFKNITTEQLLTSTCGDNSLWSAVPELCQRKSCGVPPNPEHGKVIADDVLFGAKAEVVCYHG
ncbi:DAF2 factor, partial [Turnix velox]|nr:DAF2 factor [Turnix velox]